MRRYKFGDTFKRFNTASARMCETDGRTDKRTNRITTAYIYTALAYSVARGKTDQSNEKIYLVLSAFVPFHFTPSSPAPLSSPAKKVTNSELVNES